MVDQDVDELYEQHIEKELASESAGKGDERRKAPRLPAATTELTVRAELQVQAIDISVSGLAFFSKFPVQVGQSLQITLGRMFTVDAEVVFCELESQDPDFLDLQFKVQCKFPEEEQGKYLLVAIKELEKRKDNSED